MAMKFTKPGVAKAAVAASPNTAEVAKTTNKFSFLKTGLAAKQAVEEAEAKALAAASNQTFGFRMGVGAKERVITFLNGELNEHGMLDVPLWRQHTMKVNGNWTDVICTAETEGYCPACEDGDSAALVGGLCVIDHEPYVIKSGQNAGKEISETKRPYLAKRGTMKLLTAQAQKRGGLTGCTYEVNRTGEKDPSVGSNFDFVQKDSLADLMKDNGWSQDLVTPIDFTEALAYRTVAELVALGVGKAMSGPGTKPPLDEDEIQSNL